jgi:hypothetical protein
MGRMESLTIRKFDLNSDYKDYCDWHNVFKRRNVMPPTKEMLSNSGLIVEYKGQKVIAGFLYMTNSSIAAVEFIMANNKAPRDIRKKSLKKLLTNLERLSILEEYKFLIVYTNTIGYINNLVENFGYKK